MVLDIEMENGDHDSEACHEQIGERDSTAMEHTNKMDMATLNGCC